MDRADRADQVDRVDRVDRAGSLRAAAADLLLGGTCLGCGCPGRLVCDPCRAELPRDAAPRWPTPTPPGLATPYAPAAYDGLVRAMVLGHKEHRLLALGPLLGDLLAVAVRAAWHDADLAGADGAVQVLLVPVPSRAAAVRARGHDHTLSLARAAARRLGPGALAVPLLRSRPGVVDQAGLDRDARRANLVGSMAARGRPLRAVGRRGLPVVAVVCDDVLTTGSTAREAQRALEAVGVPVLAVATVAATRRRHPPATPPTHGVSSGAEVPPSPGRH